MGDRAGTSTPLSPIELRSFCVSPEFGFILENPLTDLPEYYRTWMDLATNLNHLIQTRQLQDRVTQMPVLSARYLQSHRELRLAHLALGFIAMGYVWQDGLHQPARVLPKALAVPYCAVSETLGLPPILVYADSILANWRLRNPDGPMEIENLDTLFTFPGGESSRGFFLVSLLVEHSASSGLQGIAMAMNSMLTDDIAGVQEGLVAIGDAVRRMRECFRLIHGHVEPAQFHGSLRVFFSGWRDNPALPDGLWYEGVTAEPLRLTGGSAAQSSSIQCFDAFLGVGCSDDFAASFLKRMRSYMPPPHRRLVETLAACPLLRPFVLSSSNPGLRRAYNVCVSELVNLRCYHLNAVARFITVPAAQARAGGCPFRGAYAALGGQGTGGTDSLRFLKSVRDATKQALLPET
ncbi:hypothetical protein MATL_G00081590 [Megalops atlanticus]|uniref:Indoleamine 2,3-dioxygenase 2 n=1 Tax=Megalops atlanticus TaxID=7932 RepID=A0A9D3TAN6_MEGAT|nr:hypothetical protein MATL_G00081590 [Megalops atlanticus]